MNSVRSMETMMYSYLKQLLYSLSVSFPLICIPPLILFPFILGQLVPCFVYISLILCSIISMVTVLVIG